MVQPLFWAYSVIIQFKNLYSIFSFYCVEFECLYSAPQQLWVNRGAFGSISFKKRDKF